MNKTMCVGSRGVNHPAWNESFYPEDLPEEWRLSYYSNEFRSLLLLHDDIKSLPDDELIEWLEELDADFALLYGVEFDSFFELSLLPSLLKQRLQALVCDLTVLQLALLLKGVVPLPENTPLYLRCLQGVPNDEQMQQIRRRGWRFCWQGNQSYSEGCAPVLFLDGRLSLRELRAQLQLFLASDAIESDKLLLVLEGQPPSIEYLRQCQILVDLLA
ncbi:MAG: hypothetical protein Q9N68_00420 [Gammaproteobacteria bacterium]|nr:hypothetical protein [Gammaproteobacteria bacterium]